MSLDGSVQIKVIRIIRVLIHRSRVEASHMSHGPRVAKGTGSNRAVPTCFLERRSRIQWMKFGSHDTHDAHDARGIKWHRISGIRWVGRPDVPTWFNHPTTAVYVKCLLESLEPVGSPKGYCGEGTASGGGVLVLLFGRFD